jgi:malonyl-CoA O-methyltransferase
MWWRRKKEATVLTVLEGYNRWAKSYHQETNPIKNLSDDLVKQFLPDLHNKVVLDAGCGTGKFCVLAENQGASKITGLDLSSEMIEIARKNCLSGEFWCGDLSTAELEPHYHDVIICALVLGHIKNLKTVLNALLKSLKPGGTIVITDFHPFLTLSNSKRTFKDVLNGETYEVPHHLHLFQEYVRCMHEHSVTLEFLEEPLYQNTPVVFGFRGKKES